jgi:hypothetical protein
VKQRATHFTMSATKIRYGYKRSLLAHVHVFSLLKKAQKGRRFSLDKDVKAMVVQWFQQYKQIFPAMLLHGNKNGVDITGYRTDLFKEFIKVYQEQSYVGKQTIANKKNITHNNN